MSDAKMRIGWNLLPILPEVHGGWRYLRGILKVFAEQQTNTEVIALTTEESSRLVEGMPGVTTVVVALNSRQRLLRVGAEQILVNRFVRRQRIDVLHCFIGTVPFAVNCAVALTVMDLLPLKQPAAFSVAKRAYLSLVIPYSVRRADVLLPISRATAEDLTKMLSVPESSIHAIPPVLDASWARSSIDEIQQFRALHRLPQKYWLYVANGYPHKNHETLLQALRLMREEGTSPWMLVLRGSSLEGVQSRVSSLGLSDQVRILPELSTSELVLATSAAAGCVFPSVFEGAGLPVFEARACGVPIVASDIATNIEFVGDYARIVPRYDAEAFAAEMIAVQRLHCNDSPAERETRCEAEQGEPSATRLLRAYTAAAHAYAKAKG